MLKKIQPLLHNELFLNGNNKVCSVKVKSPAINYLEYFFFLPIYSFYFFGGYIIMEDNEKWLDNVCDNVHFVIPIFFFLSNPFPCVLSNNFV